MMRLFLAQLLILTMLSSVLCAQNENISLNVSAYGILPSGDYGDDLGDDAKLTRRFGFDFGDKTGLASYGMGLGIELQNPVITNGLQWIVSMRVIFNPTDPDAAESKFSSILGDTVDVSFETGNWLHFPALTGFRYNYTLMDDLSASVMAQAGISINGQPTRKGKMDGVLGEDTEFDFKTEIGFEIGFGLQYDNWHLGFSYLDLGTPSFEGTRNLSERVFPNIFVRENKILSDKRSISMFLISVGYSFKNIF